MPKTIAIITPTIGRSTLTRTIESGKNQLIDGDEWWIIKDTNDNTKENTNITEEKDDGHFHYRNHQGRSKYGNAQRNYAMSLAKADLFVFLDDDDILTPNALSRIREESDSPMMFRMFCKHINACLWSTPGLSIGNVGGSIFVIPNIKSKYATWGYPGNEHISDFHFISETLKLWPPNSLKWIDFVIQEIEKQGHGK